MALTKGIHHVAIKTENSEEYEKTVSFYRDLLGMPVYKDWKTGVMLDIGGGSRMEIMNSGSPQLPQGVLRHIAFETDDVDACIAAVRGAGCVITDEPHDVVIQAEKPYPLRVAFCIGPAGEEIEFFKEI